MQIQRPQTDKTRQTDETKQADRRDKTDRMELPREQSVGTNNHSGRKAASRRNRGRPLPDRAIAVRHENPSSLVKSTSQG